ncbi:MAG TPA: hypothetical protein VG890_00345 [Puia sp.]|nr:hypothetical protein [Puia sp.]
MYNFIFYAFYGDDFQHEIILRIRKLYATFMVSLAIFFQLHLMLVLFRVCSEAFEYSVLWFLFENFKLWFCLILMLNVLTITYLFYTPERIERISDRYWEGPAPYDELKALLLVFLPEICSWSLAYGHNLIVGV